MSKSGRNNESDLVFEKGFFVLSPCLFHPSSLFHVLYFCFLFVVKAPGLLSRPSEETLKLADSILERCKPLKGRLMEVIRKDAESLGELVAKQGEQIVRLQDRERQLVGKISLLT